MYSKPNANSFFKKVVSTINSLPRKHFFALIILFVFLLIASFIPSNDDVTNSAKRKLILPTSSTQGGPNAEPIKAQEKLPEKPQNRTVNITIKSGDTLSHIFHKEGLTSALLQELLIIDSDHLSLGNLRIGQRLILIIAPDNHLKSLSLIISHSQVLRFTEKGDTYISKMYQKESIWQTSLYHGKISGSFSSSAFKAGLNTNQTYQVIGALSEKIAFNRQLQKGDSFRILVSKELVDGQYTGSSEVLAAYIKTRYNHYTAFLHNDGRYYDVKGKGLGRAYRRRPVDGNVRISSAFNLHRLHPVTGKVTHHLGTDFAVGVGTKIYATGDGIVVKNAKHFAAGNYLVIQNSRRYSTRFLHLSKSYVRRGQRVKMGDLIALSGKTGRITGPHLHFEFRVNGRAVDAMKIKLPLSKEIPADQKSAFNKKKRKYMKELGLTKEDVS